MAQTTRHFSGWDFFYYSLVGIVCLTLFLPALLNPLVLSGSTDVFFHMWPVNLVAAQAIHCGEWPQWNPTIFCGTPLSISTNNTFYYPPTLLVAVLEPNMMLRVLTLLIPLHMLAAAIAARACMGVFIRSRFWAVYAALAYWAAFPLFFEVLASPSGNGYLPYVILPWWLFAIRTASLRSVAKNLLLQSVMLSYLLLGGFTQYILYVLALGLMIGMLDAAAVFRSWRTAVRRSGVMLAAIGIATMVAGIRLIPFAITLLRTNQGTSMSFAQAQEQYSIPLVYLYRFFAPYWMYMEESALCIAFVGTITAALTVAGLSTGFISRDKLIWYIPAILITLIMLGTPAAAISHFLMGGQSVPFWRITMFLVLPLVILAGKAGRNSESPKHRTAMRRAVMVVLVMIFVVQIFVWSGFSGGEKADSTEAMAFSIFWLLLSGGVYGLLLTTHPHKTIYRLALLLLLVGEMFFSNIVIFSKTHQNLLAPIPTADFSREPTVVPQDGRVMPQNGKWWGNMPIFAGWYNSSGYESISPTVIAELYLDGQSVGREARRWVMPQTQRARQLTATQWWYEKNSEWQQVPDSLPRVRMVFAYEVVNTRTNAIARVLADDFPLHSRVVIETAAGLPAISTMEPDNAATAILRNETPNSLTIATTTVHDGILVVADTFYDGWEAFVDGQKTAIFRVNSAFRGVLVAAGTHTVKFIYRQPGFHLSRIMSGTGVVILLLLLSLVLAQRFSGRFSEQ